MKIGKTLSLNSVLITISSIICCLHGTFWWHVAHYVESFRKCCIRVLAVCSWVSFERGGNVWRWSPLLYYTCPLFMIAQRNLYFSKYMHVCFSRPGNPNTNQILYLSSTMSSPLHNRTRMWLCQCPSYFDILFVTRSSVPHTDETY